MPRFKRSKFGNEAKDASHLVASVNGVSPDENGNVTIDVGEGGISNVGWNDIDDKPTTFAPSEHNHNTIYYSKQEVDNKLNEISPVESELYTIKATSEDTVPAYLDSKVDNVTVVVEGNEIKVKAVDGLIVGITNINDWLNGTEGNIQTQINDVKTSITSITGGMQFKGKFETKADLNVVANKQNGDVAVVLADESREGQRALYVYSESLGMWDFVGAFEFSDEFVTLSDTPNSYVGHNGKVVKVDEPNKKLVFANVDWSEIQNKPSSTITQIDDTVTNRHTHANLNLLQTYTNSNHDISNAVSSTHRHNNKDSLDKLGVNASNELTINGVVYTPKTESPKKSYLYARRMNTDQTIGLDSTLIFNSIVTGNIAFNISNGYFTLEQGKTYRITGNFDIRSLNTFMYIYLAEATTRNAPVESGGATNILAITADYTEGSSGTLDLIITPTSTRDFIIRTSGSSGDIDAKLTASYSSLVIQEI